MKMNRLLCLALSICLIFTIFLSVGMTAYAQEKNADELEIIESKEAKSAFCQLQDSFSFEPAVFLRHGSVRSARLRVFRLRQFFRLRRLRLYHHGHRLPQVHPEELCQGPVRHASL